MATNHGQIFDYGTVSLTNVLGGGSLAPNSFSDKTVVISFVDIDLGWSWVGKLASLAGDTGYTGVESDTKIVIVCHKFSAGYVSVDVAADLVPPITSLGLTAEQASRMAFLVDDLSYTAAREETVEHQDYWSYIVGTDGVVAGLNPNAVADKWGSTDGWGTLLDPEGYPGVSFSAMDFEPGTSLTTFDPSNDANLVAHLLARLQNLTSSPRVIYSKPAPDTWINGPFSTELYFSKPMNPGTSPGTAANDPGNYNHANAADHGDGWGSLTVASTSYLQVGNPASKVALSLTGTPSDADANKVFTIPALGIPDTYGVSGVAPTDPLPNPIPYKADVTPPSCSIDSPSDGITVYTNSVSVSVSGDDGTGDVSGVAGYFVQVGSGTLPGGLTSSDWSAGGATIDTTSDGNYYIYAWAIDHAGNVSITPAHRTITKITPSITIGTPTVTYKKYDPGTVLVTVFVTSAITVTGWDVTASASPGTIPARPLPITDHEYTFPAATADGNRTLYLHVADESGFIETESFAATKDTTFPTFTVGLQSAETTNDPSVDLRMTAANGTQTTVAGYVVSQAPMPADIAAWLAWEGGTDPWTAWDGTTPLNFTHVLATGNFGTKDLRIWVRDEAWNVAERIVTVHYQMRREIMLALDFSGSMNGEVSFDYQGQDGLVAGDYTKYAILKSAVEWFVDLLISWDGVNGTRGAQDAIGAYVFRDHLELLQPLTAIADGVITGGDDLKAALAAHSPPQSGQLTAMGAGMAQGLIDLDYDSDDATAGARRALLVVTDGMQNRLPVMTVDDSGSPGTIDVTIDSVNPGSINTYTSTGDGDDTADNVGGSNYTGTIHYRKESGSDLNRHVQVNTLGIGDHEPWQQYLATAALASRDDGESISDANGYSGVNTFFEDMLTKIYAGNTPQSVFRETGYFPVGQEKEIVFSFDLNRTVASLAIVLSWAGHVPLTMTVRKGAEVIASAKVTTGNQYRVEVIDFPHRTGPRPIREFAGDRFRPAFAELAEVAGIAAIPGNAAASIEASLLEVLWAGSAITPEGPWSIAIRPEGGFDPDVKGAVPYFLAVMVEERSLRLKWDEAPSVVPQGGTWNARVRIGESGALYPPLPSVTATLTGPAVHPGDILREVTPRLVQEILENPQAGTLFAQLRERAAADPHGDLAKLIRRLDQKVILPVTVRPEYSGKSGKTIGRYRGSLGALVEIPECPGIYRVDLVVRGRGKVSGSYRRILRKSIIVPFKADSNKTTAEAGPKYWVVTPKDANGMPLGPGFAESIRPSNTEKRDENDTEPLVVDKGDGSYLVRVGTPPSGKKGGMELVIGGDKFKIGSRPASKKEVD